MASAQSAFKTLIIENLSLRNAGITWANLRAYLGRCPYGNPVFIPIEAGLLQGLGYKAFWEIVCIGTLDGVPMPFACLSRIDSDLNPAFLSLQGLCAEAEG